MATGVRTGFISSSTFPCVSPRAQKGSSMTFIHGSSFCIFLSHRTQQCSICMPAGETCWHATQNLKIQYLYIYACRKIICTLNTHLSFTSLFIFLLLLATIWRGVWRALLFWRGQSQKIPSKIQKINQENLSKSKLCVTVRKNPLHTAVRRSLQILMPRSSNWNNASMRCTQQQHVLLQQLITESTLCSPRRRMQLKLL